MRSARASMLRGLAVVSVLGVAGCAEARLKSQATAAATGCQVEIVHRGSLRQLRISPCEDGASLERARRFVLEHCASVREAGINHIEIASWNSPGYTVMNWSPAESETCALRCNGRGC